MANILNFIKKVFLIVKNALQKASDWVIDVLLKRWNFIIFIAIFTIARIALCVCIKDFVSLDYTNFLSKWCTGINLHDGFANFGEMSYQYQEWDGNSSQWVTRTSPDYNYSMPYLYILTIISYFKPEHYLYGIKIVSIIFDFILAIGVALLCKKITKSNTATLVGYGATLFLPMIFINSAVWAQCDVMFSAFIVYAIYFFINGNNRTAMVMFGISFALKIQSIFFVPVILLLMAKKKVNIFYIFYALLAIFILNIPALCLGMSFNEVFIAPYKMQTTQYTDDMNLNSPNLYCLLEMCHYGMYPGEVNYHWNNPDGGWFSTLLQLFTVGTVVLLFVIMYRKKFTFTAKRLVLISYFFAMFVPFVMPHMHERYWFLADALSILFAICYTKHFYIAVLSGYPSFRCLLIYLFETKSAEPINYVLLALMMFAAIILTFILILKDLNQDGQELGEKAKSEPISPQNTQQEEQTTQEIDATIEEVALEEFFADETLEEKQLEETLTKIFPKDNLEELETT